MKSPLSTKTLLIATLALSILGAVSVLVLGGGQAVLGTIQLALFPLLLILLSAISLRGVRLPRILVGLSAIGVLCGAFVRYSDVGLEPGAFGISRFESDALENKTRIFRDRVRSFTGERSASLVGVISSDIQNEDDLRKVLDERPQLGGVIWGGERWLNISFRNRPSVSIATLPANSVARRRLQELGITDLQLISQVPWIGLSKGLDPATFEFVGQLLRSINEFSEFISGGDEPPDLEHHLLRAASIKASWTSIEHLAAPKWMLGTMYLMRAISGPVLEWGDLLCAEASLRSARLTLKSGANPAMMAAILNSEAILRLFKAEYSGNPDAVMKDARNRLIRASKLRERSRLVPFDDSYWGPIVANLKVLGAPVTKKARR